jgi:hypothetical protein
MDSEPQSGTRLPSTILKGDDMRNKFLVVVVGAVISIVVVAAGQLQPLNVKTGRWQMTKAITWSDVPPQMAGMMKAAPRTITYNSCVTTKDLNSNPWANGSGDNCTWTVLTSTSTDMELRGTGCDFGRNSGMTAEVQGTIHILDSESGTGSMTVTLTGNGQTMHGHASYTGKWVGASCSVQ